MKDEHVKSILADPKLNGYQKFLAVGKQIKKRSPAVAPKSA